MTWRSCWLALMFTTLALGADQKAAGGEAQAVPAAAVRVDANTWRYTDGQGRIWLYRRTPFGIMKAEDKPAANTEAAPKIPTKVVEEGDRLRFERRTPFGPQRWVRKKSELTPAERQIWEEASRKKETAKPAAEEHKK